MNVSAWSIKNPIPAVMLFVMLSFAGMLAFKSMKVQQFPDLDLPTITVSASYLVPDITASGVSKSGLVGKKQTPPITIDVPPTIWAWLTIYVYHWPQGWVLMGSEQDRLPGCNAALVTDQYKYIRARSPG